MSLITAFSKLCVSSAIKGIQRCSQQQFHMTPIVCAEPMKKRKRMDPAILKARADRRKRKIEKQIRKLQKSSRQMKPIEENERPRELLKAEDLVARSRPKIQLSGEQSEYRALIQKDWARYQRQQHIELKRLCSSLWQSQQKALVQLRSESEDLYQAAIQPQEALLPITVKGPVHTPPIKTYVSPAEYLSIPKKNARIFILAKSQTKINIGVSIFLQDGDYKDVSKKWE